MRKPFLLVAAVSCALVLPAKDFSISDFGAKGDGMADDTTAVQRAIDACAAAGGGRVVVEKGVYRIRPVMLASDVDLHLAGGAKLLGSGDWRDYPNRGNLKKVVGSKMPLGRDSALITADGARNVSITGKGVIDGNGRSFMRELTADEWKDGLDLGFKYRIVYPHWGRWRFVRIGDLDQAPGRTILLTGCTDVTVRDVTLEDSAVWGYLVNDCDRVTFDNCKVFNQIYSEGTDGIHVNSSCDVTISNCTIESGDDALCFRASNQYNPEKRACERVTVTNCRLRSHANCIRLGWERDGVVRDCTFSNVVMHDSWRGINVWINPPTNYTAVCRGDETSLVENVVFSNIVMDRIYRMPITVQVHDYAGVKEDAVRNLTFANITARSYLGLEFMGCENRPLRNFTFTGCRFNRDASVKYEWDKTAFRPFAAPYCCRDFKFDSCEFEDR